MEKLIKKFHTRNQIILMGISLTKSIIPMRYTMIIIRFIVIMIMIYNKKNNKLFYYVNFNYYNLLKYYY